jgi:hypothetical protein
VAAYEGNVGAFVPAFVDAGHVTAVSKGNGAHDGARLGAVETDVQEMRVWDLQTRGVDCTQMETALSMMHGANESAGTLRTWKHHSRQGPCPASLVGPVSLNNKKRKNTVCGNAGGSTKGGKQHRRVAGVDDAVTQEMAVVEIQPRHQL